jgi:hypothetical protein
MIRYKETKRKRKRGKEKKDKIEKVSTSRSPHNIKGASNEVTTLVT